MPLFRPTPVSRRLPLCLALPFVLSIASTNVDGAARGGDQAAPPAGNAEQPGSESYESLLGRATAQCEKKEWEQAAATCRQAAAVASQRSEAFELLCYIHVQTGAIGEAEAALEKVRALAKDAETQASAKQLAALIASKKPGGAATSASPQQARVDAAIERWHAAQPAGTPKDHPWIQRVEALLAKAKQSGEGAKAIDRAKVKQRADELQAATPDSPEFESAAKGFLAASLALLEKEPANPDLWAMRSEVAFQVRDIAEGWVSGLMCELLGGEDTESDRAAQSLLLFQESFGSLWPATLPALPAGGASSELPGGGTLREEVAGTGAPIGSQPELFYSMTMSMWFQLPDAQGRPQSLLFLRDGDSDEVVQAHLQRIGFNMERFQQITFAEVIEGKPAGMKAQVLLPVGASGAGSWWSARLPAETQVILRIESSAEPTAEGRRIASEQAGASQGSAEASPSHAAAERTSEAARARDEAMAEAARARDEAAERAAQAAAELQRQQQVAARIADLERKLEQLDGQIEEASSRAFQMEDDAEHEASRSEAEEQAADNAAEQAENYESQAASESNPGIAAFARSTAASFRNDEREHRRNAQESERKAGDLKREARSLRTKAEKLGAQKSAIASELARLRG